MWICPSSCSFCQTGCCSSAIFAPQKELSVDVLLYPSTCDNQLRRRGRYSGQAPLAIPAQIYGTVGRSWNSISIVGYRDVSCDVYVDRSNRPIRTGQLPDEVTVSSYGGLDPRLRLAPGSGSHA